MHYQCTLLSSAHYRNRAEGPLWLPGPQRSLRSHLIKLSHNENSHNEINFNYSSQPELSGRRRPLFIQGLNIFQFITFSFCKRCNLLSALQLALVAMDEDDQGRSSLPPAGCRLIICSDQHYIIHLLIHALCRSISLPF